MDSISNLNQKIRLPAWLRYTPPPTPPGFCSINLQAQGFSIAYVSTQASSIVLQRCEFIPCEEKDFLSVLYATVKAYHLEGVQCSWMLDPARYKLLLLEELPVQPSEFQSAIRWKLKGSLSFPIDDAVIDHFTIPTSLMIKGKKNMMAVVSQASYLKPIAEQINASGLQLTTIDIPELGYRNIMSLYEQDELSTALIHLQDKESEIVICQQRAFYFSRHIEWGLELIESAGKDSEKINQYLDKLALEIQRSFDYYQSQWRYPAPTRILLSAADQAEVNVSDYLSQRLSIPIQNLDLNQVMLSKRKLDSTQQSRYLAIIGGALRKEIDANAAN